MAAVETGELPDELDDRLALLFVACDEAAGAGRPDGARPARGLRAHDRRDGDAPRHPGERRGRAADPGEEGAGAGARRVPGARRRRARWSGCRWSSTASPACSPSRTAPCSTPATRSPTSVARHSRSPTHWSRSSPTTPRCAGCVPSSGSGSRADPPGWTTTAWRSPSTTWTARAGTTGCCGPGSTTPRSPRRGDGRFALEAAISGRAQHRSLRGGDRLAADRPALRGARAGVALPRRPASPGSPPRPRWRLSEGADLGGIEAELARLADEGPSYARRDAAFALADLCWRTGRAEAAAARYRDAGDAQHERGRAPVLREPERGHRLGAHRAAGPAVGLGHDLGHHRERDLAGRLAAGVQAGRHVQLLESRRRPPRRARRAAASERRRLAIIATYDAGEASASRSTCGASGASWSQSTTASPTRQAAVRRSLRAHDRPRRRSTTTTSRPAVPAMVSIASAIGLRVSTTIRPCTGSSDQGCSRFVVMGPDSHAAR